VHYRGGTGGQSAAQSTSHLVVYDGTRAPKSHLASGGLGLAAHHEPIAAWTAECEHVEDAVELRERKERETEEKRGTRPHPFVYISTHTSSGSIYISTRKACYIYIYIYIWGHTAGCMQGGEAE
jgi:hypothetical protein